MIHITLKTMIEMEVYDILHNYPSDGGTYYYKNNKGEYHEIIHLDLLRGGFMIDDGSFLEFEKEIKESHIYIKD